MTPIKSEDELRKQIDQILIASAGTLPQGEKDKFFYEVLDARRSEMLDIITNLQRQHERELVEARAKCKKESYEQYLRSEEFYALGKVELNKILFPDHCSSCHSEWADGYGDMEEPCCSRATSNIGDAVMRWHISKIEKQVNERLAQLTTTQEGEK